MTAILTRVAVVFATLLIASAVFVGAAVFLCYAVYLFLAGVMPPAYAALSTAFLLLAFAAAVIFIGRGMAGRTRTRPKRPHDSKVHEALEALIGADAASYASKNPFATSGIAFLIGIAFGLSPRLRRVAAEILRL